MFYISLYRELNLHRARTFIVKPKRKSLSLHVYGRQVKKFTHGFNLLCSPVAKLTF